MRYEDIEASAIKAMKRAQRRQRREERERQQASDRDAKRMYASARHSRLTADWSAGTTSADAEIRSSLTTLRGRCRSLGRDSAYAKRAKRVVVNNVIGSGIGLQAQVRSSRNRFNKRINENIEGAFRDWWDRADYCHTGGTLSGGDFERALMAEVFEAGEVFVRQHFTSFGGSEVPYALELIESERVPHGVQPGTFAANGDIRMGIEVDKYHRPIAYWIRDHHPSDFHYPAGAAGPEKVTRVDASEIIHLRIVERWPQTRGVPWLHAVANKINDMSGYSHAEIVAARGAANYMATVETDPLAQIGEEQEDGSREVKIAPGLVVRLNVGEKLNFVSPNRPNSALDSFMRYMLRETAAGADVSYEALSRDYSQSNYSSSRLGLLDDRDTWRVLQSWFIKSFRSALHRNWLRQATLARVVQGINLADYGINAKKYEAARYKPRGWSWVDPAKEVKAYKEAEKAGYITKGEIIDQTSPGQDFDAVITGRRQELDAAEEQGLSFDTDQQTSNPPVSADKPNSSSPDDEESTQMRIVK